jgi:hypothetical protein
MDRQIEPELLNWFDEKLKNNGLAQHAMKEKNARLLFGLAAEACVGIVEVGGNNNGPLVRLIQKTIGEASREPWCASFVQSCLAYAEQKTGQQSPVFATEHVQTMWNKTPQVARVKTFPLKYAIVCWRYEGTSNGHTGIVNENNRQSKMYTIEGNTNDDGAREGHGVFYKKRDWIRNGSLVKLGFLKPF